MKLIDKDKFEKLSNEQKIVAICRDVIKRITEKNIIPHAGSFVHDVVKGGIDQKFINNKECEVFAKGGIMMAWIGNFNKFNLSEFNEEISAWPTEIVDIFGRKLLDEIEIAFEQRSHRFSWSTSEISDGRCGRLKRKFSDKELNIVFKLDRWTDGHEDEVAKADKKRLIAIMRHLILNKGKFVL